MVVALVKFNSITVEQELRKFGSLGSAERGQEGKERVFHMTLGVVVIKNSDGTITVMNKFDDQEESVIKDYSDLLAGCTFQEGKTDEELLNLESSKEALTY